MKLKPALRWFKRLFRVVLVLIVLLWIANTWVLPRIVQQQMHAAFPDLQFTVAGATPWRAVLTDISLPVPVGTRIVSVVARYSPWQLWRKGEFKTIQVTGAEIHLPFRNGRLDWQWPVLPRSSGRGTSFQQLLLRACTLVVDNRGNSIRLPLEGTLSHDPKGIFELHLKSQLHGAAVAIDGTVDTAGKQTDLSIRGHRLDLASLAEASPMEIPARLGGAMNIVARYHPATDAGWSVQFEPRDAWFFISSASGHIYSGRGLSGTIDARFSEDSSSVQVRSSFGLGLLRMDGTRLSQLSAEMLVSASRESDGWTFRLKTPSRIVLDRNDLANLRGVEGVFFMEGNWSAGKAMLNLSDQSWMACQSLPFGKGTKLSTGGTLQYGVDGTTEADFHADTTAPVIMKFGSAVANLGSAHLGGRLCIEPSGEPQVATEVSFDQTSLEAAGVKLAGLGGHVPMNWNTPVKQEGAFSIKAIEFQDVAFPAMSGTAHMIDGKFVFTADWPLLKGAILNAKGNLQPGSGRVVGQIEAVIPKFTLTQNQALRSLFPALKDADITGTFALDSVLKIDGPKITPKITLSVENARYSSDQYKASVEDVIGAVTLTDFSPLSTPGDQHIAFKKGNVGKLDVADGSVNFRLENLHCIFLEKFEVGWAGGQLYSHALRIDPFKPEVNAVVFADGLGLKELLGILTNGKASGDGRLYGRLPVNVRWPQVDFGAGFLYAAPGTGTLQLGESAGLVGNLMEQSDPRFASDPVAGQVKKQLVEALKNFEYDQLRMDFTVEGKDLVATLRSSGRGRTGARQPLVPTLKIRGLDAALNQALIIKKGLSPDTTGDHSERR